ncbi:MAG: chemotaxis protein MotB [Deltaproteobacteria bacterium]|nr:MAG: chemotaxis protein MotB [Deltaproteobacteria bacterium]
MRTRMLLTMAIVALALGMGACTRFESTYMKQVGEAGDLHQQLSALQQQHEELLDENRMLKTRIEALTGDLAEMTKDRDTQKAESDSLSQTIVEMRGRIAVLETENRKLRQDTVALEKSQKEKVRKVSTTYQDMVEKMKKEISEGQVTISELKGKLTVNMVDAVLFDTGKAEVKQGGLEVLKKVISILKGETEKAIRIEGHTDDVPISGTLAKRFPTNWELSAARAINVTRFLQEQGIDPDVLSAVAYGEYKPISDNETPEGRAMNRRIEIILIPRE